MEDFFVAIFGYALAFIFLTFIIFILRFLLEGFISLFIPKKKYEKIDDLRDLNSDNVKKEELEIFAESVSREILTSSSFLVEEFKKRVFESGDSPIGKISEKENNEILLVTLYLLLFHTQSFFFENFIKDEDQAKRFEVLLFAIFEKVLGGDSRYDSLEVIRYVDKGDGSPSREFQFIGSKICDILKKSDGILMLQTSTIFSEFLINIFYNRMNELWINYSEKIRMGIRIEG